MPTINLNTDQQKYEIKNLLKDWLPLLKECNAFLAGGAISSMFSNSKINDFDIFFRCEADYNLFETKGTLITKCLGASENAITFEFTVTDGHIENIQDASEYLTSAHKKTEPYKMILQAIRIRFGEPMEVINNFDFIHTQGAFDFKTEEFFFHDMFFQSILKKTLIYNPDCTSPILSLFRTMKFKERGYSITPSELLKITFNMSRQELPKTYRELFELLKRLPNYSCLRTLPQRIVDKYSIDLSEAKQIFDDPVSWNLVFDHLTSDNFKCDHQYATRIKDNAPKENTLKLNHLNNVSPVAISKSSIIKGLFEDENLDIDDTKSIKKSSKRIVDDDDELMEALDQLT